MLSRIGIGLALLCGALPLRAEPYTPTSDQEVLVKLPRLLGPRQEAELAQLARALQQSPRDPDVAEKLAGAYLDLGRRDADPRYYGMAQAAIMPWQNATDVPVGLLQLRAEIRGFNHEFSAALQDYDQVLARSPERHAARLQRSVLSYVMGDMSRAASDCATLPEAAEESVTCRMNVASAKGDGATALALFDQFKPRGTWAMELAAESAAKAGDAVRAEKLFRESLAQEQRAFTAAAFADFLLKQNRFADALAILPPDSTNLTVMVRRAMALAAGDGKKDELENLKTTLDSAFALEKERGDDVHGREFALYLLEVKQNPTAALPIARANWAKQKEPIDAEILAAAERGVAR